MIQNIDLKTAKYWPKLNQTSKIGLVWAIESKVNENQFGIWSLWNSSDIYEKLVENWSIDGNQIEIWLEKVQPNQFEMKTS